MLAETNSCGGCENTADEKAINEEKELFLLYRESKDTSLRNKLVLKYMRIVKYAAFSTRNIYGRYADADDIVNEATIALMNAIDSFDPEKNNRFETYASIRVRGAVLDYIRRQDIIPRTVRKFARDYDDAYSKLFSRLQREPDEDEIAAFLGISRRKLESYMAKSSSAQTLSFEEMVFEGDFDISDSEEADESSWQPEKRLLDGEMKKMLAKAIDRLNERERTIISLYYYEKLKYSEIAEVMEVSQSRVCQMHSAAVSKLRKFLEEYIDG